jgi:hypothetical protein
MTRILQETGTAGTTTAGSASTPALGSEGSSKIDRGWLGAQSFRC